MPRPSIVWFRDDLRLADNPALRAAIDRGEPVIGLYVLEESEELRPLGGAARWWLHGSLAALAGALADRGSALVLRRGEAADVVAAVVRESGAGAVFWNRRYGGAERDIDAGLKSALRADGVAVASFSGSLLSEPWTVRTGGDRPYSVFTPFWRATQNLPAPRPPLPAPGAIPGAAPLDSDDFDAWMLRPQHPDWAEGLRDRWVPGEDAARARLDAFLADDLGDYDRARDEPASEGTSLLSPRLRWGELSPHQVWHATVEHRASGAHPEAASRFLSELGWREFAWHTLFHFPDLALRNWRAEFDAFPWPRLNPAHLAAAAGTHRRRARGRRDAGAVAHRAHAQPRADGDGILPGEEPADRLARGRAVVLGHARRRGCGEQPVQLAVGRRFGRRRGAVLPDLQSGAPAAEVRPARRVRPPVGARSPRRHPARARRRPRRHAPAGARRLRRGQARPLTRVPRSTRQQSLENSRSRRGLWRLDGYTGTPAGLSPKSWLATLLLSILLGELGIDRFYLGKIGTGTLELITVGGFGIWWLIDLIVVIAGAMKDKRGLPVRYVAGR